MIQFVRNLIGYPSRRLALGAAAALALPVAAAQATWSILIVDTRTGEIAIGSATCVQRINLLRETPVMLVGVGAVTAQSAVDATGNNRAQIRDGLLRGAPLEDILAGLALTDGGHNNRQYGMIDVRGGALTYSGIDNADWAGGVTGSFGDVVYAIQGNILSGGNVVEAAEDAVRETPGDLAEKLMAGMVAARVAGGDGRCSCSPGAPTACGSPPPAPFKSADVGYMVVARAGDKEGARGFYDIPARPNRYAAADIDGDTIEDILATSELDGNISVFRNDTAAGDSLSFVTPIEGIETGLDSIQRLLVARVTPDEIEDLVVVTDGGQSLAVFQGDRLGDGTLVFGFPERFELPGAAAEIATGPLDTLEGEDIAVTIPDAGDGDGKLIAVSFRFGAFSQIADIAVSDAPTGLAVGRINGPEAEGSPVDIAVTKRASDTVEVFARTDPGSPYESWSSFEIPGLIPVALATGDLIPGGGADLVVVGSTTRRFHIAEQTSPGVFDVSRQAPLLGNGLDVVIAEMTGDGRDDLVTLASANNGIEVHAFEGSGFTKIHQNRAGGGQKQTLPIDLNRDGLTDIISGSNMRGLTILDNLGDGTFPPYNGFAGGDYFLTLNIAGQLAFNPDPVDQMVEQFAAWRTGLSGLVDAVNTRVTVPSRVVAGQTFTVRVEARDWTDQSLEAGDSIEIEPGTSGVEFVSSTQVSPGVFDVTLRSSAAPGTTSVGATVRSADLETELMPGIRVRTIERLADFDGNGTLNFFDLSEYLEAFNAGDPAADADGSGAVDTLDPPAWIKLYLGA